MALNSAPYAWTIQQLIEHIRTGPFTSVDGVVEPARPFGCFSLRSRIRLAWAVFTGRADALYWPGQQPKAY